MNKKPDFNQHIQQDWNFWGMNFHFTFPGPDNNIIDMQPSVSSSPGEEPWGFYEQAIDLDSGNHYSTGQFKIMNMEQLTAEKIESLLQNHKLHFSRRRFNHSWFVEYAEHNESFWFDIWIHRHQANINLFEPKELQLAHLRYLMDCLVDPEEANAEEFFGDDLTPEWEALNWRWSSIGGYQWQVYDEIKGINPKNSYVFGYNFLLPLSSRHYLHFRFYRLNASRYQEALDDFEKLVNCVLQNFSCNFDPQTSKQLQNMKNFSELTPVNFQAKLSTQSLNTWQKLDSALRTNTYKSICTKATPIIKKSNSLFSGDRFAIILGIVALILFFCIGKGYFFIQDWLSAHPSSKWHWVQNSYLFFVLLWCLRDRLKKLTPS